MLYYLVELDKPEENENKESNGALISGLVTKKSLS
jgi:hypothetical protein